MGLLYKLFGVFFQIGFFSIGGGYAIIPLIQERIVQRYGWIPMKTFTDIITISQMTPGPLAVNASTFVGLQIAGVPGAVLATLGCVLAGVVISVLLYSFFQRHRQSTWVMEVLNGLKSASLGLIISAAVTILLLSFTGVSVLNEVAGVDWVAVCIFAGCLFVMRKFRLNPILLMLAAGVIGIFVYR